MHLDAAVLAQRIRQLERVQLHIRIAVREPLDHSSHGIFGACLLLTNFVADILKHRKARQPSRSPSFNHPSLLKAMRFSYVCYLKDIAVREGICRCWVRRGHSVQVCIPSSRSLGSRR